MTGGGILSTAVKHSRMDQAQSYAHEAERALRRFSRELSESITKVLFNTSRLLFA